MSQVNYIQQINMFMEFGKRNGLTSYERMFWLGLFHIANMWAQRSPNHEWPDDFFPVSNSEIEAWSGLEERNIRAIRNRFKQIGLIDFKKGDGRKSDPEYRLFYLRYISYKIVPDTPENGCKNAPDSVGDCVGDCVGDAVSDSVSGRAGDFRQTGGKNAADGVPDPLYGTPSPSIPGYININGERVKAGTEKAAEAGRTDARPRARTVPAQRYEQRPYEDYPPGINGGGLVDLDEAMTFEGLVSP